MLDVLLLNCVTGQEQGEEGRQKNRRPEGLTDVGMNERMSGEKNRHKSNSHLENFTDVSSFPIDFVLKRLLLGSHLREAFWPT